MDTAGAVASLEAHRSFGPEHSKARWREIFSSKHCDGHGDPYPMQVAAHAVVKAVCGGGFFFPKLDGVARLLPSSSDGVDGTYGCGTTSSPSSLASSVPKGDEKSGTTIVYGLACSCELKMKLEQLRYQLIENSKTYPFYLLAGFKSQRSKQIGTGIIRLGDELERGSDSGATGRVGSGWVSMGKYGKAAGPLGRRHGP
jgi:hypothetical protein